jgi:Amt family ammonium transporter
MQAGFMCLESGLTRTKNSINVAIKNLTDFSISVALFWILGFALMFGTSGGGWIGITGWFYPLDQDSGWHAAFFIFQAMFCVTAATIVSGAVAEQVWG